MKNSTRKIISLALAGTIISGAVAGTAMAENERTSIKDGLIRNKNYFYIVREGDTLGKISQKFYGNAGYYDLLAIYNNILDPSVIYPGDILLVPWALEDLLNVDYSNQDNQQNNNYIADTTYTVKNGDTLYCIVNLLYGLSSQEAVDKLATYNNLDDPNKIMQGQILLIPCLEKLFNVQQRDYSLQYNQMGWKLNHEEKWDNYKLHKHNCPPLFIFENNENLVPPTSGYCKTLRP